MNFLFLLLIYTWSATFDLIWNRCFFAVFGLFFCIITTMNLWWQKHNHQLLDPFGKFTGRNVNFFYTILIFRVTDYNNYNTVWDTANNPLDFFLFLVDSWSSALWSFSCFFCLKILVVSPAIIIIGTPHSYKITTCKAKFSKRVHQCA